MPTLKNWIELKKEMIRHRRIGSCAVSYPGVRSKIWLFSETGYCTVGFEMLGGKDNLRIR